jgi:hypothetical protein
MEIMAMKRILGTCLLGLTLVGCAASPSNNRMSSSGGSGYNVYERQIMVQLENHENTLRRRGFRMDDYFIGSMRESERYQLNATISRGDDVVITGACDQDCRDLDLIIYDDRGRELDRDTLVDDLPVLNFRAPYSGDYTIEAVMYQCSVNPCYFGVSLNVQ